MGRGRRESHSARCEQAARVSFVMQQLPCVSIASAVDTRAEDDALIQHNTKAGQRHEVPSTSPMFQVVSHLDVRP